MVKIRWTETERSAVRDALIALHKDTPILDRLREAQQCLPTERQRPFTKQVAQNVATQLLEMVSCLKTQTQSGSAIAAEPLILKTVSAETLPQIVTPTSVQIVETSSSTVPAISSKKPKIVEFKFSANDRSAPRPLSAQPKVEEPKVEEPKVKTEPPYGHKRSVALDLLYVHGREHSTDKKFFDLFQNIIDGPGTWASKGTAVKAVAVQHKADSVLKEFLNWMNA